MQTITTGRVVRYTFRRNGELLTRPAIVTDVFMADKDTNPDPARNPRAKNLVSVQAIALVVFDIGFAGGSLPVSQVFEDDLAPRKDDRGIEYTPTDPMLGCWAWPTMQQLRDELPNVSAPGVAATAKKPRARKR
jgi:hypothetical protein